MVEKSYVVSHFYNQTFRIHGHLAHDIRVLNKRRWYIYQVEDLPCRLSYIGSTTNPTARWSGHKSSCNIGPANKSGLSKHFQANGGCPNDQEKDKSTLEFTLLDYMDVSEEELIEAGHVKGPQCRCKQCAKLKDLEDRWILKMGTYWGEGALNSRDEIQSKTRCHWGGGGGGSLPYSV